MKREVQIAKLVNPLNSLYSNELVSLSYLQNRLLQCVLIT